jgi:hypothetical protein
MPTAAAPLYASQSQFQERAAMLRTSSARAQANLGHFRAQYRQLGSHVAELDDRFSGHANLIDNLLRDAEQAFKARRYRKVGPWLNRARSLLQYVTGELVEADPENLFSWRSWLQCHMRLWPRQHRMLKLAIPLLVVLAVPMGVHVNDAVTVHDARNAVTASLAGLGYVSTGQVLTAAGLPPSYQFYSGKPQPIQDLRSGQMAWVDSSNIEGSPGAYGIVRINQGVGSMVSNDQSGVTSNNLGQGTTTGSVPASSSHGTSVNTNTVQQGATGDLLTGLAVLVVNTGHGFIGVAFQAGCYSYNGTSSGFLGQGFSPGDTPIKIWNIPLDCPSTG